MESRLFRCRGSDGRVRKINKIMSSHGCLSADANVTRFAADEEGLRSFFLSRSLARSVKNYTNVSVD